MSVAVAEVHAVAEAIAPHLAVGTLAGLHPFPVTIHLKLVLPNIPKVVLIDISLMVVGTDAEASRNGAVGQDGGHIDASATRVIMVAHLALITSQKSVASIVYTYPPLLSSPFDEFHHLDELSVGESQFRVVGGTSRGEHGKEPPTANTQRYQIVAELRQVFDGLSGLLGSQS